MRFPSPLIVILLCGASLSACASSGSLSEMHAAKGAADGSSDPAAGPLANRGPVMDLEAGVKQAQTQRLAGQYDEAIRTLSQLMLVASDDPRVVGEYGKTLAEKGRAQDAVQFLTRATELQQSDWTFYSALGVAYDQVGNQASAQIAYERALKLKPEEASVLNNYALSRMLANDAEGARQLIARAEAAGGGADPKIARNIEMMNKLAVKAAPQQKAAAAEPPTAPMGAPVSVSSNDLPAAAPVAAPAEPAASAKIVMQTVPADPLAGPAKPATREPTPLHKPALAKTEVKAVPDSVAAKESKPEIIKAVAAKSPAAEAKAEPSVDLRPTSAKGVKAADVKPSVKSPAKPATKNGIPALRQTASAY